ncbi:MAG: hypothetical protein ACRDQA_22695 [Nocardioidaceae bacterium]
MRNDRGLSGLTVDEDGAVSAGYRCGVCLDFGWLDGCGPCPACGSDEEQARLLDTALAQYIATRCEDAEAGQAAHP